MKLVLSLKASLVICAVMLTSKVLSFLGPGHKVLLQQQPGSPRHFAKNSFTSKRQFGQGTEIGTGPN